jgi:transcriptional regulator with XRE-family HTH domain
MEEFDKIRSYIARKVRALRQARRWTQAELARHLRLSQNRLSEIERGKGSFTAEQLLTILRLFNVSVTHFAPRTADRGLELQNALARLGASHLKETDQILPNEQLEAVTEVVRRTLVSGSPRLVTALGPVLVNNIDRTNLQGLNVQLAEAGLQRRLAWLVDNILAAIRRELSQPQPRRWARRLRRTEVILGVFLEPLLASQRGETSAPPDILDAGIRSERTLKEVKTASSAFSKRWGVVTRLQPEDFVLALRGARADD